MQTGGQKKNMFRKQIRPPFEGLNGPRSPSLSNSKRSASEIISATLPQTHNQMLQANLQESADARRHVAHPALGSKDSRDICSAALLVPEASDGSLLKMKI